MRFYFDKSVAIYRLSQTGSKSAYGETAETTVSGYLRPLDEEQSAINGIEQFGVGFRLWVEVDADIQVTDKVVIDSITYLIRGVKTINRLALSYKSCVLTLPDND